ncbi:hypothetical protein AYI69_g6060 [Smittium culicis]|uniref:Uncharacterized protein n=1 Tax=Smittium culicis TaxID=133412 RepID=A0A1R1Y1Y0_9FUNG|nr:hypothetical protein AYI69_g6060 [Smittium culicis]
MFIRPLDYTILFLTLLRTSFSLLDKHFENDPSTVFHLTTYGLYKDALIDITLGNILLSYPEAPGHLSILAISSKNLSSVPLLIKGINSCSFSENSLLSESLAKNSSFLLNIPQNADSWSKLIVPNSLNSGWWSIYLLNCKPFTSISFWSRINIYQRPSHNFLSAGQTYLPLLFLLASIFQHLVSLYYLYFLFKNSNHLKNIHISM